jgi:hypothetical protein
MRARLSTRRITGARYLFIHPLRVEYLELEPGVGAGLFLRARQYNPSLGRLPIAEGFQDPIAD